MSKQFPHQMSCQDVRMDPRYQKPPQYADINHHRVSPQTPVEVNEIGPTIQQGVIQHPVQRHSQAAGERPRGPTVPVNVQQMTVHLFCRSKKAMVYMRGTESRKGIRRKMVM